jgi:hypothetical protein
MTIEQPTPVRTDNPPPLWQPPRMTSPSVAGALRVIGLLLVLGLLAAAASSVVAQFFRQHVVQTAPLAADVTHLVTTTDTGEIRVRTATAGEQPRMITTLNWSFDRPELHQTVTGNTERVDARCSARWFVGGCSVDVELVVPAATDVEMNTDTGSIYVEGTSGGVAATTTTGTVTLSEVSGTSVSARTNTGDVTLLATGSNAVVAASTDTGDVQMSFASAPRSVRAQTSTGDISIRVPGGDSYAVTALTDVGEKNILLPNDPMAARSLSAVTSVGGIQMLTSGQ